MNYALRCLRKEIIVRLMIPVLVWQLKIRNPITFLRAIWSLNQSRYITNDKDV